MIPFGVKILWFVLSLTGLLSSWLVLIPFGRAVGAMWGPGLYCVGNTILQVIFCLGLIWRMDPFLMPKGFCVAQTLIIGFATYALTGVAGAFSMATSLAVLRPRGWDTTGALKWRNVFLLPVLIFPVAATIVHVVIVIKLASVKPTDDLHCDSSDPEWVRFLSYAGVPFIVSLPCLFFSIKSLVIIWNANKKIQRTNRSLVFESVGNYTSMPPRSLKHGSVSILIKDPEPGPFGYQSSLLTATRMSEMTSSPSFVTANEYPPSPKTTAPASAAPFMLAGQSASPVERKFHLPFRPSLAETPDIDPFMEDGGKQVREEEGEKDISSTMSGFGNTGVQSRGRGKEKVETYDMRDQSTGRESDVSEMVWANPRRESGIVGDGDGQRSGITTWQRISRPEMRDNDDDVLGDVASGGDVTSGRYMTPMEFISQPSMAEGSAARGSPNLAPAIWRIILFQTAFCAVQILTCISTIVDLATHRATPTPLGSQHFALLLAAWGPAIIFGHSPAVRKSLKFWGGNQP